MGMTSSSLGPHLAGLLLSIHVVTDAVIFVARLLLACSLYGMGVGDALQLRDVTACKSKEAQQSLGKNISLNNCEVTQNCHPTFTAHTWRWYMATALQLQRAE